MNYVPPRPLMVRPSGLVASPTIPMNPNVVSEPARRYQRILLGVGFSTGPQGADGRFGPNSANATQSFARWYNALPEGPMLNPQDLKRGAVVTVNRDLTAEKQIALDRFAARASDQLSSLQQIETTIVRPSVAPAPFPWKPALAIGGGAAVLGLVIGLAMKKKSSNRKSAQ